MEMPETKNIEGKAVATKNNPVPQFEFVLPEGKLNA